MSQNLTTSQVADALGVDSSTVRHYRSAGRIEPSSLTPGGHARYDLEEVVDALGLTVELDRPAIRGLRGEAFAPLGQTDLRSSGRGGSVAAEVTALRVREVPGPSPARWGGELLTPRGRGAGGA